MIKHFAFFLALAGLIALVSCKREGSSVTSPPDDVSDTTSFVDSVDFTPKAGMSVITGWVYDFTHTNAVPLSGVRVMLDSPLYGAYTDSLGRFFLSAPPGTHTLTLIKNHYGTIYSLDNVVPDLDNQDSILTIDTILTQSPYLYIARKPSYQPVHLNVSYSNMKYSNKRVIITAQRRLSDPAMQEPAKVVVNIYRSNPSVDVDAQREVFGFLDDFNVVDSTGKLLTQVRLDIGSIRFHFHLQKGDTCYVTLQYAGGAGDVRTYDKNSKLLIPTDVGPESEAVSVVLD